jgi:hypothetical protein
MSDHNDIASPQDGALPPLNDGIEGRDERVVEYLRQRLASVIASGSAAAMEPAVNVSRFSEDLEDEDWGDYGGSDQDGDEAAYPNTRAEAWDEEHLDPAWIIDRYCSWQEEDLEDALMEEGEESEVNQFLSSEWNDQKDGKDDGTRANSTQESTESDPGSKGNHVPIR